MRTPIRKSFAAIALLASALSAQALTFNFVQLNSVDATALAGFQTAANRWSSIFTDDVNMTIRIGFQDMGSDTIIGGASSRQYSYSYTNFKGLAFDDQTSAADASALKSLGTATSTSLLLNRYNDNPAGAGSLTPWLDNDGSANNQNVVVSQANLRALHPFFNAYFGSNWDTTIIFNTRFAFDYNSDDGIDANKMDFVGVATHEIGHGLGFLSRADVTDNTVTDPVRNLTDSALVKSDIAAMPSTLDLFRYSLESFNLGAIDLTADTREKYFSIDGGVTKLATFSTGQVFGDKRQSSHWKDNLGIGIMDPTFAYGELGKISALDVTALDVIGWDVAQAPVTPVPEPSTYGLMGAGALAGLGLFRRFRRRR